MRVVGAGARCEYQSGEDDPPVAADHYVYALTDYREVDRSIALARL
jgi:hypothetical protein